MKTLKQYNQLTAQWEPVIVGKQGIAGPTGPTGPGVATGGSTGQVLAKNSGANYDTAWVGQQETIIIAVSDEVSSLITGVARVTFRMPFAMTLTAVRASLTTASSSGIVTFDINENGASILSTLLSIDESEKTSTTAASQVVISDSTLADDAEITIDVDAAGTAAKGAKIYLIGRRA